MAEVQNTKRRFFSQGEKLLLIEIVEQYKYVVENKKTDAVTSKQKEEAWVKIVSQFNRQSTEGILRTTKQLHTCYLNQKRESKQKVATDKVCALVIL
jgi:endo-alpha-1,4-polygalactosaminidase (GH114 family)